jgi:methylmalonyl-CoA/ethylmalonyl-CoA epimerase
MVKMKKINHVAIVVADIDVAAKFWRDIMGIKLDHVEEVPSQKSKVAFMPVGNTEIELVQPTSEDSGVAKFLAEKGGGMHHLCFEVDDCAATMTELKSKGVRLLSEEPNVLPGRKMAFIHPKSTGGVLVELYEITK